MLDSNWKPPEDRISRSMHGSCGDLVSGLAVFAILGLLVGIRGAGLWLATAMAALGGGVLGYSYCERFWKWMRRLVEGVGGLDS